MSAAFDPVRWEWWSGDNDEVYGLGPFGSREDALAEARFHYDDHTIYLIEATRAEWPAPTASSVIDDMLNNCDELFSEDFPDLNGTQDEQKECEADLQLALNAWMDRWRQRIFPTPTMFGKTRNAEVVIASGTETGTAETVQQGSAEGEGPTAEGGDAQGQSA